MGADAAVDAAVTACIEQGVLADYFTAKRAEVLDMMLSEYNEAEAMELFREEGREEERRGFLGRAAGLVASGAMSLQQAASAFGFSEREIGVLL